MTIQRRSTVLWSLGGWGLAFAVLVLLYAPMVAVAVLSVNASKLSVGGVWGGFTLDWYTRLAENRAIRSAAVNTFVLGVCSTVLSTVLGTLVAIGRERLRRIRGKRWAGQTVDGVMMLPVVVPDIILAAALVVAFRLLRWVFTWEGLEPGLMTMVIGHVTFQVSFVALVVGARMSTLPADLDEAARDLYASGWYLFTRIQLPLLLPAVIGGAMLAMVLSLDDFVISFFVGGPESATLPMYIYSSVKRGVSPELHALSTLITLATVLLVIAAAMLTRSRPAGPTAG